MPYSANSLVLPFWAGAVDPGPLDVNAIPGFADVDLDSPFHDPSIMVFEAKPIYSQVEFDTTVSGSNTTTVPLGGGFTQTVTENYSYTNTTTVSRKAINELMSGVTVEPRVADVDGIRSEGPLRVARSLGVGSHNTPSSGEAVFRTAPSRGRKYTVSDLGNPPSNTSEYPFSIADVDYQSMQIGDGSGADPDLLALNQVVVGTQQIDERDASNNLISSTTYDITMELFISRVFTGLSTHLLDEWSIHDTLSVDHAMGFFAGITPIAQPISNWDIDISAWTKAHWHDWTTAPDHPFTWDSANGGVDVSVEMTIS